MNDEERQELLRSLLGVVQEAGLSWVTDEVTDLIARGVEEQIVASEWQGLGRPKRGESRTTRREFAAIEQIELLVTAVERVIVDLVAVEDGIATFFGRPEDEGLPIVPIVQFKSEPDRDGDATEQFLLAAEADRNARREAIPSLVDTLNRVLVEART